MAQQTAVDWYVIEHRKLLIQLESKELSLRKYVVKHQYVLKKANKMFEEQITNAHLTGLIRPLEIEATKQAQQYYNETYGK